MADRDRAVEVERFGGAMERFGGAGMALLPWTRHMIAVLWDQLRLLVQVIYYTFISVFQMFRFEVHVRITDDPSVTPDPSDPFLFSSLFSEEGGADHTEALLSSLTGEELLSTLRGEELCCDGEGIYIGHKRPAGWTATVGDWNFFVSSSDEDRSGASCWSSEDDHLEFDCEESKALWESLSRSGDPYDPFCFSACISTRSKALWESQRSEACWETESTTETDRGQAKESKASWETESRAPAVCDTAQAEDESEASWETESTCSPADDWEAESGSGERGGVPVGRFWDSSSDESSDGEEAPQRHHQAVRRSDSNSSWSSDGSDGSDGSELQENNQLLWDLFTNNDPYNPLSFRATAHGPQEDHQEELWGGLSKEQDPYHPLNFTALELKDRRTWPEEEQRSNQEQRRPSPQQEQRRQRGVKPSLTQRRPQRHSHPQMVLQPWTRASALTENRSHPSTPQGGPQTQRKVRFSDVVQVHIMRSWDFARRSSRKGVWEELARDRDRFRRRIQDSERTVGPCLSRDHRDRVLRRIRDWTRTEPVQRRIQDMKLTSDLP